MPERFSMPYQWACNAIFAYGRVPAGPVSDETEIVGLAFDRAHNRVVRVHDAGCCREILRPVRSIIDAVYQLRNAPESKVTDLRVVDLRARSRFEPDMMPYHKAS